MPRPVKSRRVCCLPRVTSFGPLKAEGETRLVQLTVDEYETIRLIDYVGMTQEMCAETMQVARTTVQAIYESARRKLACALVEGTLMRIEGGAYQLCERRSACGCGLACHGCPRRAAEGGQSMIIAVPYENGEIFQHFGHTRQFKLYTVEDSRVVSDAVVDTMGSGHSALAAYLSMRHVTALICGGIGAGAKNALAAVGIAVYGGCTGQADEAVAALLAGSLRFDPDAACRHHEEEGRACSHHCGENGCHRE